LFLLEKNTLVRKTALMRCVSGMGLTGQFPINNLHTTDLDNPMPQRGFQASGFGIQYDQS
jgi:hypothetical protein